MYARLFRNIHHYVLPALAFCLITLTSNAQDKGTPATSAPGPNVLLYTPYSRISVSPGQTVSYSIKLINSSSSVQNISLAVSGLPKGWTHTLKSGTWDISRISVLPKKQETLTLTVMVPLKVNKGAYKLYVRAPGIATLPLTIVVSQKGTYKTAFSTTQPNLEGAAKTSFTFNATLQNETADTSLYALNDQAPPGWQVTFKASYKQVASVNVNPNQTQNITITIKAPDQVPAGKYTIPVYASNGHSTSTLRLEVVITGSYSMTFTTPTGLLSTDITAGDDKRVKLIVKNTGSAPLTKVKTSFTAPANWDVTFDPSSIDLLAPGQSAEVFATIKAYKDAIAGDYAVTLVAKTAETSSEAQFRISVKTPMLWGWIGILIILVAIGSVYYLFRKYGRR